MATMDMIKFYNGEPANFLDLGGGIQEEGVHQAFRIIISDKNVGLLCLAAKNVCPFNISIVKLENNLIFCIAGKSNTSKHIWWDCGL